MEQAQRLELIKKSDLEEITIQFDAMIEFKDVEFEKMDVKIKEIKKAIERIESNINHFGER